MSKNVFTILNYQPIRWIRFNTYQHYEAQRNCDICQVMFFPDSFRIMFRLTGRDKRSCVFGDYEHIV